MLSRFPAISLVVLTLFSCTQSAKYSSHDLSSGWSYEDVVQFNLDEDQQADEIEIIVNHDMEYTYENLYLKLDLTDGQKMFSDTISIRLSDDKGLWKSDCSGTDCLLNYNYTHAGEKISSLVIAQFSREETLNGINSIGINLK